jgi:hypothetical protein
MAIYAPRVASPVPDHDDEVPVDEVPDAATPADAAPIDPGAIELRYRYHRARRHARVRARQESRLARYRFYIVMAVLLALAVAFVIGSWHEIQRLFGL